MHFPIHLLLLMSPILFVGVTGEIVKNYRLCSKTSNCDISQLRIVPCPEALLKKPKPCIMKKGKNATIEFDFTGKEGMEGLTTGAYWSTPLGDVPLEGMDTNGCNHITCPITGKSQTYSYVLEMKDYFPPAEYKVKWRLSKGDDVECCFTFRIKVES